MTMGLLEMKAALSICLLLTSPVLLFAASGPERFASVDSWTGEFKGTYDAEVGSAEGSVSDHRKLISGRIELSGRTFEGFQTWRGTASAHFSINFKSVMKTSVGDVVMTEEADADRSGTAVLEIDLEPGRPYQLQIRLPEVATEEVVSGPGVNSRSPVEVGFEVGTMHLNGTLPPDGMTLHGISTLDSQNVNGVKGITSKVEWTLNPTTGPLKAVAVVAPVYRGTESVLDGSGSKGKIKRWTWTVEPKPECGLGKPYTTEGKTARVLLLCDSNVKLRVEDGSTSDETKDPVLATVRPRRWKIKPNLAEPIYVDDLPSLQVLGGYAGKDRCGIEKGIDDTGHEIHHLVGSKTWKVEGDGDGYTLQQAHDGPFAGVFYVATEKLKVNRMPVVNVDLAPGSALDQANTSMGTGQAFARLHDQVWAHEKMHGMLVAEELRKIDPAPKIEEEMDENEKTLTQKVDTMIGLAEGELKEATTDEHVKERLRQDSRFACNNQPTYVFLRNPMDPSAPRPPKLGPGDVGRFDIHCYADLGAEDLGRR